MNERGQAIRSKALFERDALHRARKATLLRGDWTAQTRQTRCAAALKWHRAGAGEPCGVLSARQAARVEGGLVLQTSVRRPARQNHGRSGGTGKGVTWISLDPPLSLPSSSTAVTR